MSYATRADLLLSEDLLAWLTTDGAGSSSVPDETIIEQALAASDARINGFLRQRSYTLPAADPDGRLKDIAAKIGRHWLYSRRPDGPPIPKSVEDGAVAADKDLADFRDGRQSLAAAPAAESGRAKVLAPTRVFDATLFGTY